MAQNEIEDTSCVNVQIWVVVQRSLHVLLVQLPINLRPWTLYHSEQKNKVTSSDALTQTAAPLDLFNIWNWMPASSVVTAHRKLATPGEHYDNVLRACHFRAYAVEGVHLAHERSLAYAAHGRVA